MIGTTTPPRAWRVAAPWLLLCACVVLVVWVRSLPFGLAYADRLAENIYRGSLAAASNADGSVDEEALRARAEAQGARLRADRSYENEDGRSFVYLGDQDSYLWLRHARNYLRTGTTCDAIVDGECRDLLANAPIGAPMVYRRSLHIVAIVLVHELIRLFDPHYPLAASAYWVPVIIGALGAVPAFLIGRRLGGLAAGVVAALVTSLAPATYLERSIGADNDVWNVVLPLYVAWAAMAALAARTAVKAAAFGLLAATFTALHAGTWSGWWFMFLIAMGSMLAVMLSRCASYAARDRSWRVYRSKEVRAAACMLGIYYFAAWLGVVLAGAGEGFASLPLRQLSAITGLFVTPPPPDALHWPSTFRVVAELSVPSFGGLVEDFLGPVYFATAMAGAVVAFAPRREWSRTLWVVVGLASLVFGLLAVREEAGFAILCTSIVVPSALVLWLSARRERRARENVGGGILLLFWFLSGLFASFSATRLQILLGPAFGVAVGVAVGRAASLMEGAFPLLKPRGRHGMRLVAAALVTGVLAKPVLSGHDAAVAYLPAMSDAWWDTLERIREESPGDAIVNAWWDYGHWIKYVAERRVSQDGANLHSHVPHWFARALLAPSEEQTIGLLRMLDCGSDAPSGQGASEAAYGRLVEAGKSKAEAYDMVLELAALERGDTRGYLWAHGVDPDYHDRILEASHCDPPESYLILSSFQVAPVNSWVLIGRRDVLTGAERPWYLSPWRWCRAESSRLICAIGLEDRQTGKVIEGFVYDGSEPARSRLYVRAPNDATTRPSDLVPHSILLLEGGELRERFPADAGTERFGVLVDIERQSVLVGSPDVLRSTFVRLMRLRGRLDSRFEAFDERWSTTGEQVFTWRIRW